MCRALPHGPVKKNAVFSVKLTFWHVTCVKLVCMSTKGDHLVYHIFLTSWLPPLLYNYTKITLLLSWLLFYRYTTTPNRWKLLNNYWSNCMFSSVKRILIIFFYLLITSTMHYTQNSPFRFFCLQNLKLHFFTSEYLKI